MGRGRSPPRSNRFAFSATLSPGAPPQAPLVLHNHQRAFLIFRKEPFNASVLEAHRNRILVLVVGLRPRNDSVAVVVVVDFRPTIILAPDRVALNIRVTEPALAVIALMKTASPVS